MSFPRYPAYKDSGVEWLGEVPEHWDVIPLKRLAGIQTGLAKGKEAEPESSIQVPFLRVANVQDDFLDLNDIHTIQIPERALDRYLLRPGDVLMNEGGDSDKLGRGCIWNGEIKSCIHQNHVFAVRPHSIAPAWLNVYTSSMQANSFFTGRSKQSTNLASISSSNLMDLPVPVAPIVESTQILNFLDYETAKIDALIAEQHRLIALLQEKRQAVISHAVTKGLNPDVPMKDSGVEWLGEVPEHWDVGPVKRFFSSLNSKRVPLSTEERGERQGEYPYYGASGVIDYVDDYLFDEALVLVSEDGANLLNRSTPIAFVARGLYWVNNHAHILKPIDRCVNFWAERIEHLSLSPFITGSAQPKLTAEALGGIRISVPPTTEERRGIEQHILDATSQYTPLIIEADAAIALLQERRSAVISAAVTGQIDVRGLVPEAVAA